MDSASSDELSVRDLVAVLKRRRGVIYKILLVSIILTALYCLLATRRFLSTGTIEVQKRSPDAVGLQSLITTDNGATDALEGNINLQTQANILQSDTFALAAIKALHLEGTHDYSRRKIGGDSPEQMRPLLLKFHSKLKVYPIGGTRLIQIEFLNPDPKTASEVVNFMIEKIRNYAYETQYTATTETSGWLTRQLEDLRAQSESAQARVVTLQKETGVYNLGTVDAQGREQAYSGVLDRLQQLTSELTQAEQNRIVKGAIAQSVSIDGADPEALSSLAGNMNGPSLNSMAVIQNLRQQEATKKAELDEAQSKFGPSWPKVVELKANIAGLEQTINQEVGRIRNRAKSDYDIAGQAETNTRNQYEAVKREASMLNDKAVEFAIAKQEADQSRQLYEDLHKRFKEASILENWRSSNINVVDWGGEDIEPKTPNVPVYMAVGMLGGLMCGCVGAFGLDLLDSKTKRVREIERAAGKKVFAVVPFFDATPNGDPLSPFVSFQQPKSAFAEAIRHIRLELLTMDLAVDSHVILVTSSVAEEGKTVLSSSVASSLARAGRRVLLVDADLWHRGLSKCLDTPDRPGLSEILSGESQVPEIYSICTQKNLDLLQAGLTFASPSELLSRPTFADWLSKWRKNYQFIVLDTPPALPVSDARILRSLADVTLLVARVGTSESAQIKRAFHLMSNAQETGTVCLVVNGLRVVDEDHSAYFGHKSYRYDPEEGKNVDRQ